MSGATGLFVFDSSAAAPVAGIGVGYPAVQIVKSSGATVFVNSSWTVNGDLSAHVRRNFVPTHVVAVSGNATVLGGF